MQNPIPKLRQTFVISKKPGFFSEKLKTLTSSNYHKVQYFLLKLRARFLFTNVYKRMFGFFFLFYLDVELLAKIKNDLFSTHWLFAFLLITQDLNRKKSCRRF